RDDVDLTKKLRRALLDKDFRSLLSSHGLERALRFSWDQTAQAALSALRKVAKEFGGSERTSNKRDLPKLAYVSPLPPSRTGIAEYSVELIAALSEYYEITCIV